MIFIGVALLDQNAVSSYCRHKNVVLFFNDNSIYIVSSNFKALWEMKFAST